MLRCMISIQQLNVETNLYQNRAMKKFSNSSFFQSKKRKTFFDNNSKNIEGQRTDRVEFSKTSNGHFKIVLQSSYDHLLITLGSS
jgi:hypothetical protein